MTIGAEWLDTGYDGWNVHYRITSVDFAGNESTPSPDSCGICTAVTDPVIPNEFALYQNVPNPFNPTTLIPYDVAGSGGRVSLKIFDVSGRLVRTLVDEEQTAGRKIAMWDGKNERGHNIASGVYFYRLRAPGFEKTLKMTFVQ